MAELFHVSPTVIPHLITFFSKCINEGASTLKINVDRNKATYCEQVHDGVTGLSKEGFPEANTEQRTRVNCKTKRFS